MLGQDHFRRVIYKEREQKGLARADLIEAAALHCLDAVQHVVLEGIFNADRYGAMLERISSGAKDTRFYGFGLSFEETVRRHATRPQAAEFTSEQMRAWFHGWQPLPFVAERRITSSETPESVVARILNNA